MVTQVIKPHEIAHAAEIIKIGGLCAVPTETVYGLAANALSEAAVEKIYAVKGRPPIKPISLLIGGESDMIKYALDVYPEAIKLARKFWPGPLTIVLKKRDIIPDIVTAGGATVGLRCPRNDLTLSLIALSGVPLAAPSANVSGEPSPKNRSDVLRYFDGKIDGVLDGGECEIGTESTIVDLSGGVLRIIRQGALPEPDIRGALGADA